MPFVMEPAHWLNLGGTLAMWCALSWHFIPKYTKAYGEEFGARAVSLIHACLSVLVTSIALFVVPADRSLRSLMLPTAFDEPTSPAVVHALIVSLTYFTVDLVLTCVMPYFSPLFIGHHILSIICIVAPMVTGSGGHMIALTLMLMELSNPFMHVRHLMLKSGQHEVHPAAFKALTILFHVVYVGARFVYSPLLMHTLYTDGHTPAIITVMSALLFIASVQFCFKAISSDIKGNEPWDQ